MCVYACVFVCLRVYVCVSLFVCVCFSVCVYARVCGCVSNQGRAGDPCSNGGSGRHSAAAGESRRESFWSGVYPRYLRLGPLPLLHEDGFWETG